MPRKFIGYVERSTREQKENVCHAGKLRSGIGGICTICGFDLTAEATPKITVSGSAKIAIPQLTEKDRSRLAVIRREVSRGYAIGLNDLRWLVELTSFIP